MKILLFIYLFCVFAITFSNSQCSIDPTWRPTMSTNGPLSISNVVPALEFKFDKNNLVFMSEYDYSSTSLTDGPVGVANSFTMNYGVWGPPNHWLISKISMPALKANTDYTFSFDFKLGQTLGTYNNIASFSIGFYDPYDVQDPNGGEQYFIDSNRAALYKKTVTTGNFGSSTSFLGNSITLTPTTDIGLSLLGIQIVRTTQTGPVATSIFISNMKLTIASRTLCSTAPPLNVLTKDSELIHIPKPTQVKDVQDPSSCPYLASDLVHWHDPSIWAGNVVPLPATSSNIVLPAGKKVLISPCSISQTGIYQKITVPPTSELIFSDSSMTMNVQDIYVQGKLIMGTKSCRYNALINIVFHGAKTTLSTIAPFFGSKGIAVASGGFMSIQGKQYLNTWTRLAATVWSGDNIINVQDSIDDWEIGQQVLITTSIYKDDLYNQNEILTIQAIYGKQIQFTTPLRYYHYGAIEYQAEVALLSRRIVFSSDSASSDSAQFGGHILVQGEAQIAGIQLKKMGQKNIRGRYPLHFHLANIVSNSYISDCLVLNSFFRAITIHGTNNLLVTRNVAYDITGHAYYLEDGVEMDNTISFNLVAVVHTIGKPAAGAGQDGEFFTQTPDLDNPADTTAGGFYFTNAWNSIIGNAASGGWCSFSFPTLPYPIGSHTTVNMVPSRYPIKEWQGNTAHSSGYYFDFGSSIYVGGELWTDGPSGLLSYQSGRWERQTYKNGIESDENEEWMTFNNTKVYLSNRSVGHWGSRVEVIGLEVADSRRSAQLFGEAFLSRAIVNGQTSNVLSKSTYNSRQGFELYDTFVKTIITDVIFRNYQKNPYIVNPDHDNRVFTAIQFSDQFKPQFISLVSNITIQNTPVAQYIGHEVLETGASRYFNFIDSDGSFSGRGVPTIIGSNDMWWKKDSSCIKNNDWNVYVCDKGSNGIASVQFWIPGLISRDEIFEPTPVNHVGSISLFGSGITDQRKTVVTRNAGVTGFSNANWYLNLVTGSPKYMVIWLNQVPYGEYVFFAISYPAQTTFKISSEYIYNSLYTFNFTQAASPAAVKNGDGKKYHFNGTHLFIKLVNLVLNGNEYFERDGVRITDNFWEYNIHITATNTVTPPVGNYFTNLPYNLPSSTL